MVQCTSPHLIKGHLHSKAFVVLIGDCWAIHIQQDKAAMICNYASPLPVNLLQVIFAEPEATKADYVISPLNTHKI